jgi:hypothetical protein
MSAAITGIAASLADVGVPPPPDGEGDGDAAGAAEGLAETDGAALSLAVADGDAARLGLGVAATIVNVVVPWAMSPSTADAVVQRTVYFPGGCVGTTRCIFFASLASTVLPSATIAPPASTSLSELFLGSTASVNVKTISGGEPVTVDLSAGLAVSSSAWPRTADGTRISRSVAARRPRV